MRERLIQLEFQAANVKDATSRLEALELMMANAIDGAEFEFQGSVT